MSNPLASDKAILDAIEDGMCVVAEDIRTAEGWTRIWRCTYSIGRLESGITLREAVSNALAMQRVIVN